MVSENFVITVLKSFEFVSEALLALRRKLRGSYFQAQQMNKTLSLHKTAWHKTGH